MYYVLCDSDSPDGKSRGPRTFATMWAAEAYADTIDMNRYPTAAAHDSPAVLMLQRDSARAERDALAAILQKVCDRAVPAGFDSCGHAMSSMRRALVDEARATLMNLHIEAVRGE